jgi:carboxylesterase
MPNREPFFFPGGASGVLLIHGFSGSPAEMRGLGERLAQDGHAVAGMRLPGHTSNPADLAGTNWRAWLAAVEGEYERLQAVGDASTAAIGVEPLYPCC